MKLSGGNSPSSKAGVSFNKKTIELIEHLLSAYNEDLLMQLDDHYTHGPNADREILIDQIKRQINRVEKARFLLAKDFPID